MPHAGGRPTSYSRDFVLQAALDFCRNGGIVRFSVKSFAKHVGCSRAIVTKHFGTTENLLNTVRMELGLDE